MVTLVIVAVLLRVGVPSLRTLLIKSQLSGEVQDFYGAISYARSEAIKRGNYVSICKRKTDTSCGGGVGDTTTWSNGWIIFTNADNDDPATIDTGEPILRVVPALPDGYTLNASSNFASYITFDRFGMANRIGTFVFCANGDRTTAKAIIVTRARPRIATDTNGNGIPETDNGTDIASCTSP